MQKELNLFNCEKIDALTDYVLKRAETFDLFDWAIFKTCLLSLGVLIGSMLAKFFKKLAPLTTIIFIASWGYLIWRVFFSQEDA